jgi:hypothetical protein
LFLQSDQGPKEILDDDLYRKKYSKINLRKLVLILEKYKNDKLSSMGQPTGNAVLDKVVQKMPFLHKSDA